MKNASRIVKVAHVDGRTMPMVEFMGKKYVPASDDELRRAQENVYIGENVLVGKLADEEAGIWIESSNENPTTLTRVVQ